MKVTLIQHDIKWEDKLYNLNQYQTYIDNIEETDIIILPEMFTTGFTMNPSLFSEMMNGETITWMKNIAMLNDCAITGSLIIEENSKYYNRLIWCHTNGDIEFYDKKHLFSFAGENNFYTSGDKQLIINYKGFRIKPLICYDLRFPVWSRTGDFDMIIYVANWPKIRSSAWRTLLKARAIENQSYVIGVNRIGRDGSGIDHSGDTTVVDANGDVTNWLFVEGAHTIELDINNLNKIRDKFPFLKDKDNFNIY